MPAKKKTKPDTPASSNLLLAAARQSASEFRKVNGSASWFSRLEKASPKTAKELKGLALSWAQGGEARDLFPRKSDLHRFVNSKVCKIGRYGFYSWMDEITSS